jgi:hypothetical protein
LYSDLRNSHQCYHPLHSQQLSISNEADFSTHTYQQDFHVAPNPKKTITLDVPGKQGRYVKIQLPTWGYVSLAEVQVMGIDPVHFSEVDYSRAQNDFGGVLGVSTITRCIRCVFASMI